MLTKEMAFVFLNNLLFDQIKIFNSRKYSIRLTSMKNLLYSSRFPLTIIHYLFLTLHFFDVFSSRFYVAKTKHQSIENPIIIISSSRRRSNNIQVNRWSFMIINLMLISLVSISLLLINSSKRNVSSRKEYLPTCNIIFPGMKVRNYSRIPFDSTNKFFEKLI